MTTKETRKIGMVFILGILLISLLSFVSAVYSESNTGLFQFFERDSKSICDEEGRDFLLQIAPFGCTPAVVRSDLLEEQNVPVFCQLAATQVNPLIDVEAISSVSFKGNYSKEIAGIAFYPAKSAISAKQNLNSAVLNNVGYIVVTLKKQSNESAMPEYVEGSLSAKIKYDVKNAMGIGQANFYLPVLSENDWNVKYPYYSFWDGRGYIRAIDVTNTEATINVYDNNIRKLTSTKLEKGETSGSISFPGFDCFANFKLKLNEIANPATRAKIRVNAEVVEVGLNEKFLDNKCQVREIQNNGISQKVVIKCDEDNNGFFGSKPFTLAINPKVNISINDISKEIGIGDYLYDFNDKAVYVGYIGTRGDTKNLDDLFVYFVAIPKPIGSAANAKLTDDQINSFSELAKRLHLSERKTGVVAIDAAADIFQGIIGVVQGVVNAIKGENSFFLTYKENNAITSPQSIFGRTVLIKNFAQAADIEIPEAFSSNYENALKDYDEVIDSYTQEKYPADTLTELGEEALYKKIELMNSVGKKKTMLELCESFKERYPHSKKNIGICNDAYKIANSEASETFVLVNGKTKKISFDDVYEPSLEDYNAEISVKGPNGVTETRTLTSNDIFNLKQFRTTDKNEFIQLISINDDSIQIRLNVAKKGAWEDIKGTFLSDTKTLKLGTPEDFGTDYIFSLNKAPHIKKLAKVSLIPNIDNAQSTAEFSFRVGIEKRWNITLAPEMTKKTIASLNKSIGTFENISNVLGNVTSVMSKACFATGVALVVKNFVEGLSGESVARQSVMRGENGWYKICDDLVSKKDFVSQEKCLVAKSDDIEKDVSSRNKLMTEQNARIKAIEAKYPGKSQLLEKTIETNKFMNEYSAIVVSKLNSLGTTFSDPNKQGEDINLEQMKTILDYDSWTARNYDAEQLKQIELNINALQENSSDERAKKRLYSDFLNLQMNYKDYVRIKAAEKEAETKGLSGMSFRPYTDTTRRQEIYDGFKASQTLGNILQGEFIQGISFNGNESYVTLEDLGSNSYRIKEVYSTEGIKVEDSTLIKDAYSSFKKIDEGSYKNPFKNIPAEARYYETEPYKGLPAVVPFDIVGGWYAATKPTMPVLGQLSPYDASTRVTNFYLCNIGKNGLEEFSSLGFGDDFCQMVNLGTNQPYNKISGLSPEESAKRVEAAVRAIEQARNQYSSGVSFITITGYDGKQIRLKVGSPAVEMPEIKCQDFMSPRECQIMFNVCDPVICPSSRCDFGGKYPVKDVVQSGIIGSIALCLPNIREGIYIPVCLTGVQAGIDGLISVEKSYRDCLQESLDTGKTVGICDEVHSLYICDFFWRQAAPLANIAIPKIISAVLGQNTHGGGEYLFAQSAWETAQKSFSSFTSYYQTNSPKAFQVRSVSEFIGDKICDVYTSATYPTGVDILSSITSVSSPPQFHGRFDEIPFTTVTVPPKSQYKVFYHIFAGKEKGAYYQVYLRGDSSSFYQDTSSIEMVASGYINVGEYASETKDFLASSGYKEMCINVNGQEECGFKEVSTSFAVDFIEESYVASQAIDSNIKTEGACISDANKGIIRICATANPEKGTDSYINTSKQRWVDVGYCSDEKMRCWLDTQSIKDVIDITTIEGNALEQITNSYLANLTGKDYLNEEGFASKLTEIERETDNEKKITLIDKIIDTIYYTNQKGYAFLLRGNAFAELAKFAAEQIKSEGEIAKTSSNYALDCNECVRVGCAIEQCASLCPAECPSTSASAGTTPTAPSTGTSANQGVLSYECENGKKTDYTCQFVCPSYKVACSCENGNWECGQCEDKCGDTSGKTENVVEKVVASDMQKTGVYECEENKEKTITCKLCSKTVNCKCTNEKWECESCETKCGSTTGKTEDEALSALVEDIRDLGRCGYCFDLRSFGGSRCDINECEVDLGRESVQKFNMKCKLINGQCTPVSLDTQTQLDKIGTAGTTTPPESADFISQSIEYNDGRPLIGELYYKYFNGKWYWSQNKNEWIISTTLPEKVDENREFIAELIGKNYLNGLNSFFERVDKESQGRIISKPYLHTDSADVGYNKLFTYRYKNGETATSVYLKYQNNRWEWMSPNGYIGVGAESVERWNLQPLSLFKILKTKNFLEGAGIILGQVYSSPEPRPTVVESLPLEFIEGGITLSDDTSKDFFSPVTRYNDGNPLWGDLHYKFFDGKWHWTQVNAKRDASQNIVWVDLTIFPNKGDENRNFITSLQGKTYSQGINLLMRRVSESKQFVKPSLHTDAADMGFDKVFTYRYKNRVNPTRIYLKYTTRWEWAASDNPAGWMIGIKLGGNFYGEPQSLLNALENKNFEEGAKIILSQEYPLWIGQQTAEDLCGYCINAVSPDGPWCSNDECERLGKETSQRFTLYCNFIQEAFAGNCRASSAH
ncbi:MAG: hypothetical protein Q7S06_00260 [Nanoarchaeota archaeon]|nr:hypothetical protein [Nanoarchaeota archaeon]